MVIFLIAMIKKMEILNQSKKMKEEYNEIISLLLRGYSVKNTEKLTENSVSTI
jgi:hypothetical protein